MQNTTEPEVIILDCETTGFQKPQVLEYAHVELNSLGYYPAITLLSTKHSVYEERFDVTNAIDPGAFNVHGISKAMVRGKPKFDFLKLPIPESVAYMIGHNISYDHRVMGKASQLKRICTLKLAKALWKGLDSYKLTALMGTFFPDQHAAIVKDAHGALVDVKLCLALLTKAKLEFEFQSWEEIYEIGGQK